jgi:hypothetical protein
VEIFNFLVYSGFLGRFLKSVPRIHCADPARLLQKGQRLWLDSRGTALEGGTA